MQFAVKYSKELCPTVEEACSEMTWDCFADYVPDYLSECIDYHKFVTDSLREVEIVEAEDCFVFLSELNFDEVKPY